MNGIRETVRQFVVEQFVFDEGSSLFSDDANLTENGILDSFALLHLATFLENEFGVQLEQQDLESGCLSSLSSIVSLVAEKRGSRQ